MINDWSDGKPILINVVNDEWSDGCPLVEFHHVTLRQSGYVTYQTPESDMADDIANITSPLKLLYTKETNNLWFSDLDIRKNDNVQPEGYVEFEKTLFIARKVNDFKVKKKITSRLKLDHIMTELNDFSIAKFEYTGITCEAALASVLTGTPWSVGTVDISGTKDIKNDKMITVLAAVNLIAREFEGEIDWICNKVDGNFTRIIDIKSQIGTATKLRISYDKNSDYMRREKDSIPVVTRLYPYGKGDITIEDVNGGIEYLDSPNIIKYKYIKKHPLYTSITDKTLLKTYGQAYLDLWDTPVLRYRINTMDLTVIPKWADEIINLGDTLRIYDIDLDLNVDVRVKKLVKNLTDPRRQVIELANKFKTIIEPISAVEKVINDMTYDDDSRAIVVRDITGTPRSWYLYLGGILQVGDYQGPIVHIDGAGRAYEIWVYLAWKPTISDVTIRLNRNGVNMGDVTIPWGAYVAPGAGEVGAGASLAVDFPVAYGDLLNLDVKAADNVGARASVALRCR